MPRISISLDSTALRSATYDPDTEVMDVTFNNGRTYTHEGVPQAVFEGLRDAGSPGNYYASTLKGRY